MLNTKGFVRPSYIVHRSKKQLGNTLIPVIIALANSSVASIAFLKQGDDLSAKAKVLEAKYEIVDALQQWNRIKTNISIANITQNDLPPIISNSKFWVDKMGNKAVLASPAAGYKFGFYVIPSTSTSPKSVVLQYDFNFNDEKICLLLQSMLSSDIEGISSNPVCTPKGWFGPTLRIELN